MKIKILFEKIKKETEHWWFLIRFFVAGKIFCDIPKWAEKYFWFFHKMIWLWILVGVGMLIHFLLKIVVFVIFFIAEKI